jgi:hypothetical protein
LERIDMLKFINNPQQPDIEARYIEVRNTLLPFRDDAAIAKVTHDGFQKLIKRLAQLRIEIIPVQLPPKSTERLGGTVLLSGHAPLIWINFERHKNEADAIDTVCHEAVHATALYLERWQALPDQALDNVNYNAEEIVARLGANEVGQLIGTCDRKNVLANKNEARRLHNSLLTKGWTKNQLTHLEQWASEAASLLAEFQKHENFIDLNLPQLFQNARLPM